MATLQDQNQDPNAPVNPVNQPTAGTSAAAGTSQGGQGAAGAPTANQTPVSPVQQNQAPQNGAGYTDVSSYLNANQQGGQQLGNQVASNLTQGYNKTQNDINNSVNMANSSIGSGYTPENTQLIQQVAANPTQSAGNADTLSQFQGQLNDTYGGPTSWGDYGSLQGEVQGAQQNANLLNTPGGNNVLTQQVEQQLNPGQTSQGINALDTLLFQGNPGAIQAAQTAAQPYSNLGTYLDTQNTGINQAIAGGQTNAANASQNALNAFTGANGTLTNLNTNINQNTASTLANAQGQNASIKADIASGKLSPQDLTALGMTQDQANALTAATGRAGTGQMMNGHNFGAMSATQSIDLSQWLSQQDPTQAVTNATTATPEQYQQMAAIQQLLGGKNPQGNAINPLNASQAGTAPTSFSNFDFGNATGYANTVADQERQAAQDQANFMTSQADLAHAQSQHGGGFFGGLKQDISHPLSIAGSVINPLSWGSNIQNIANGQPVGAGNVNPLKPTASAVTPQQANQLTGTALTAAGAPVGVAHGGEIGSYLDKNKKVK